MYILFGVLRNVLGAGMSDHRAKTRIANTISNGNKHEAKYQHDNFFPAFKLYLTSYFIWFHLQ